MFEKSFEKQVEKYFSRAGWALSCFGSGKSNFFATKEIFGLHVMLGPDLYDHRFPQVDAIYGKRVAKILGTPAQQILVIVLDKTTLPLYRPFPTATLLLWDEIDRVKEVELSRLCGAAEPSAWAEQFVRKKPLWCLHLAREAGGAGHAARALYWARHAAEQDGTDPIMFLELAKRELALGDLEAAAAAAAAGLVLAPASGRLLGQASQIARRRGDLAGAIAFALRAVDAADETAADYHHLARLYIAAAELTLAETAATQAVALEPENVNFSKTLAEVRTRRHASAKQHG